MSDTPLPTSVEGYAALFTLLSEMRSQAKNTPRQDAVIIHGRFLLDKFGQFARLNRNVFTDELRAIMPMAMSSKDFEQFWLNTVKPNLKDEFAHMYEGRDGFAYDFLPPPHIKCCRCDQPWTFEDSHNIENECQHEPISLAEFEGKTLAQALEALSKTTDSVIRFPDRALSIRNDRWKNSDGRGDEEGWIDTTEDDEPITLDYIIQPGDETLALRYCFYHSPCFKGLKAEGNEKEWRYFANAFTEGLKFCGFEDIRISHAPLPDYVQEWFMQAFTQNGRSDIEGLKTAIGQGEFQYSKVETREGTFGYFQSPYHMLDLTPTGLKATDFLATAVGSEMPVLENCEAQIIPLTGDHEQLHLLWQKLIKKARTQTPASSPA